MAIISVIVPVYKVEPYLHRCVSSILSQTFSDLELILVDDGSPDNCPAMCDAYAAQDRRVHVIHQKNRGLSAARNAALDYLLAKGSCSWLTLSTAMTGFIRKCLSCSMAQFLSRTPAWPSVVIR